MSLSTPVPRQWILSLAALAIVALWPIWTSRVLPTADGPSHVYNAFLLGIIRAGTEPFASVMTTSGQWHNVFTAYTLGQVGPMVGWEIAERLLASAIFVAIGATMVLRFSRIGRIPPWVAATFTICVSGSWFFWMGFYDFCAAVAAFLLVASALEMRDPNRGLVLTLVLTGLCLAFLTHIFVLAVCAGLLIWAGAFAWLTGQGRAYGATCILLGGLAFAAIRSVDGTGGSDWGAPLFGRGVAGILVGDPFITFHPFTIVTGVLVMGTLWIGMIELITSGGVRGLVDHPILLFGLCLILGGIVVPDAVGSGSYISARCRYLGVLLMLPPCVEAALSYHPRVMKVVTVAFAGLAVSLAAFIPRAAADVARYAGEVEEVLTRAGVARGDWVSTLVEDSERNLFRISGYQHASDRAAVKLGVIGLDNYQPAAETFPVRWVRAPGLLDFREASSGTWLVDLPHDDPAWASVAVVFDRASAIQPSENLRMEESIQHGDLESVWIRPVR